MRGHNLRFRVISGLVLVALFASVTAFSPNGDDPRIQDRLYEHLDAASRAYLYGHTSEATAYAEMVLLSRAIKVSVDDSNVPDRMKDSARRAFRDAMINWEEALNGEVKFVIVPRRDADVVVSYTGDIRVSGDEAAGTVRWTRQVMNIGLDQFEYFVRATIVLRTHTPRREEMNYDQMLHTAGHELGHILGLEDSRNARELMGPLRLDRPVQRATTNERDSLIALRHQAGLILRLTKGDPEPSPTIEPAAEVPSAEAEIVAVREDSGRLARSRGRGSAVRRPVRDEKTQDRTSGFKIGRMAL